MYYSDFAKHWRFDEIFLYDAELIAKYPALTDEVWFLGLLFLIIFLFRLVFIYLFIFAQSVIISLLNGTSIPSDNGV